MPFRYEFRSSAGTLCCAADDARYLCDACRAKARSAPSRTAASPEAPAIDDAGYEPFGQPADGYALALAAARLEPSTNRRLSLGLPSRAADPFRGDALDGYAVALHAMKHGEAGR